MMNAEKMIVINEDIPYIRGRKFSANGDPSLQLNGSRFGPEEKDLLEEFKQIDCKKEVKESTEEVAGEDLEYVWAEYQKRITEQKQWEENGIDLFPQPGFVVKTRVPGAVKKKVFVNLVHTPLIAIPVEEDNPDNPKGPKRIRIPMSCEGPTTDVDKDGEECIVFDVCLHTETVTKAQEDSSFRDFVVNICMENINRKASMKLNSSDVSFPKMKYKGQGAPRKHHIQRAGVVQKRPVEMVENLTKVSPLDALFAPHDSTLSGHDAIDEPDIGNGKMGSDFQLNYHKMQQASAQLNSSTACPSVPSVASLLALTQVPINSTHHITVPPATTIVSLQTSGKNDVIIPSNTPLEPLHTTALRVATGVRFLCSPLLSAAQWIEWREDDWAEDCLPDRLRVEVLMPDHVSRASQFDTCVSATDVQIEYTSTINDHGSKTLSDNIAFPYLIVEDDTSIGRFDRASRTLILEFTVVGLLEPALIVLENTNGNSFQPVTDVSQSPETIESMRSIDSIELLNPFLFRLV